MSNNQKSLFQNCAKHKLPQHFYCLIDKCQHHQILFCQTCLDDVRLLTDSHTKTAVIMMQEVIQQFQTNQTTMMNILNSKKQGINKENSDNQEIINKLKFHINELEKKFNNCQQIQIQKIEGCEQTIKQTENMIKQIKEGKLWQEFTSDQIKQLIDVGKLCETKTFEQKTFDLSLDQQMLNRCLDIFEQKGNKILDQQIYLMLIKELNILKLQINRLTDQIENCNSTLNYNHSLQNSSDLIHFENLEKPKSQPSQSNDLFLAKHPNTQFYQQDNTNLLQMITEHNFYLKQALSSIVVPYKFDSNFLQLKSSSIKEKEQKIQNLEQQILNNQELEFQLNKEIIKNQDEVIRLKNHLKSYNESNKNQNHDSHIVQDLRQQFNEKQAAYQQLLQEKSKLDQSYKQKCKELDKIKTQLETKQAEVDLLSLQNIKELQQKETKIADNLLVQIKSYQNDIKNLQEDLKERDQKFQRLNDEYELEKTDREGEIQRMKIETNNLKIQIHKLGNQNSVQQKTIDEQKIQIIKNEETLDFYNSNKDNLHSLIIKNLREIEQYSSMILQDKNQRSHTKIQNLTDYQTKLKTNSIHQDSNVKTPLNRLRNKSLVDNAETLQLSLSQPLPSIQNKLGIFKNYTLHFGHKTKKIYDKPFFYKTTFDELFQIKNQFHKQTILCVGAYHRLSPQKLMYAAFDQAGNIFKETYSSTLAEVSDANIYWYFVKKKAFGFSSISDISLDPVDMLEGELRLSWSLLAGGARVGNMNTLQLSQDYFKVIYQLQ